MEKEVKGQTMASSLQIQYMLKNAGVSRFVLTRREKHALERFIKPDETIEALAKGFYAGGKGILIATDQRLLLIDARMTSTYSRVVRYERLQNIQFSRRLFDSKITMLVDQKSLVFKSHTEMHLARLSSYVRGKVLTQEKSDLPSYLDLLDQSAVFELRKKILIPRHRHGKFPVSFQ